MSAQSSLGSASAGAGPARGGRSSDALSAQQASSEPADHAPVPAAAAEATAAAVAPPPRRTGRSAPVGEPAWKRRDGAQRVMGEFMDLIAQVQAGQAPIHELSLVDDQQMRWQFKIRQFDGGLPGGAALNADLAQLTARHGQDHILMEVRFPDAYPTEPPFVRVVSPRMKQYTGHVTVGGSICIPLLSLTSSLQGWQPAMSIESVLNIIIVNFMDAESVYVRTPTGPGGLAGPLRIDLRSPSVMLPYSEWEARSAFSRVEAQHAGMW